MISIGVPPSATNGSSFCFPVSGVNPRTARARVTLNGQTLNQTVTQTGSETVQVCVNLPKGSVGLLNVTIESNNTASTTTVLVR